MGSTQTDDRTTASRIRDAALRLFSQQGFTATTVRQIASSAGVPVGLVNYHFGSKQGLQDAVDEHVIRQLADEKLLVAAGGSLPQLQVYLAEHVELGPLFDYLVMSLRSSEPAANHLFDRLVLVTREVLEAGAASGTLATYADAEAVAVVLVAHGVGASLMGEQIARHFGGVHLLDESVYERYARASLDLHMRPLFADPGFLADFVPGDPDAPITLALSTPPEEGRHD